MIAFLKRLFTRKKPAMPLGLLQAQSRALREPTPEEALRAKNVAELRKKFPQLQARK